MYYNYYNLYCKNKIITIKKTSKFHKTYKIFNLVMQSNEPIQFYLMKVILFTPCHYSSS